MQRSNVLMRSATCALVATSIIGCKVEDTDAPAAKAVAQAVTQAPKVAAFHPPTPMPPALPAPPDVAAPPKDAVKTASGLYTKVLQPGTGTEHPRPFDIELINYAGWRKDGVMFDRSGGKKPYSINLNQVVPGWAEGLQLMVVGEKRRLWIPAKLAFGDTPRPSGYAEVSGDVVIDVELVNIDTSKRAIAMQLAQQAAAHAPESIAKPQ